MGKVIVHDVRTGKSKSMSSANARLLGKINKNRYLRRDLVASETGALVAEGTTSVEKDTAASVAHHPDVAVGPSKEATVPESTAVPALKTAAVPPTPSKVAPAVVPAPVKRPPRMT